MSLTFLKQFSIIIEWVYCCCSQSKKEGNSIKSEFYQYLPTTNTKLSHQWHRWESSTMVLQVYTKEQLKSQPFQPRQQLHGRKKIFQYVFIEIFTAILDFQQVNLPSRSVWIQHLLQFRFGDCCTPNYQENWSFCIFQAEYQKRGDGSLFGSQSLNL